MKMKKILLTSAVAVALLSGCNNDYDGQDIAGSKLIVSASIDQVNTRVSDDGIAWTVGDAIGVSDNLSNPNLNIKYVAGSVTGEFSSTTGIYILGNDEVEYTAYYPYTGNENISAGVLDFKIVDEACKYVGHNAIDFMYAKATASRSNPNVAFKFKHQMSKVSLNIANGGAAETKAEASISYTLQGVIIDGTFDTATGEVKPGSTKGSVKVETTLGTTSSIILPPVVAESEAEPIQLVIEVGDKIYAGSLKPALDSSQEYLYTVDLSKTESGEKLQIDSPTIDGWKPNDVGNIGVEEEVNYNPTLEIGDFFCTDGTLVDKEYDLAKLTDKTIAGVVYYVGNPQPSVKYAGTYTEEQDILRKNFPNCTNGLVLSVETAKGSHFTDVELATVGGLMNTWVKNESGLSTSTIYSSRYAWDEVSNAVGNSTPDKDAENNFLGYNNTYQWKEFAKAKSHEILALTALDLFVENNPLPNTTSGWYIPSLGELKTLIVSTETETPIYSVQADVAASLEKLGATAILQKARYWSSTEGRIDKEKATSMACVYWKSDAYTFSFSGTSNNSTGYFHFAFAF